MSVKRLLAQIRVLLARVVAAKIWVSRTQLVTWAKTQRTGVVAGILQVEETTHLARRAAHTATRRGQLVDSVVAYGQRVILVLVAIFRLGRCDRLNRLRAAERE